MRTIAVRKVTGDDLLVGIPQQMGQESGADGQDERERDLPNGQHGSDR